MKSTDLLFNQLSYEIANPISDVFWRIFTLLGDTEALAVVSVLLVAFLLWQKKIQEIILYLVLMASGILLTLGLKLTFQKERPGEVEYIDFLGFGKDIVSYSFPSGHAVKSLLMLGFIIWFIRKNYRKNKYTFITTRLLLMAIVLCGIGQIFLHEHYLSDVIGGYLIGSTIQFYFLWIYYFWLNRQEQSKIPSRKIQ